MKKVITTGKTVELATELALKKLGVPRDRVIITVLKQPSRGLFGLFGKRDAEVEVEVLPETEAVAPAAVSETEAPTVEPKPDPMQETLQFVEDVVAAMKLDDVTVTMTDEGDHHYTVRLSGESIGLLIGRRGATLDSLQVLVNLVANKHIKPFIKVTLDAEDYRERRQETLERLADRLAEKAIKQRRDVLLEPMPNGERKIIHSHLQGRRDVITYSQGEEPHRRVVISPKDKAPGSQRGPRKGDRRPRRKNSTGAKTPNKSES
ncbi:MAG TPA: RNA-binding cell elongation regulator Jag/EloR [Bacilli bacterium]|nr:RNA-binding cell elongation regulator Jag/EloR [Bacilli bacterium]